MSAQRGVLALASLFLALSFGVLPAAASVPRVVLVEDFTATW